MKIAICKVEYEYGYINYDDYNELYKLIPLTDFEEATQKEYIELRDYIEKYNRDTYGQKYVLLSYGEKSMKNTILELKEKMGKIKKEQDAEKRRQKAVEEKRKKTLEKNKLERDKKKLEKLKKQIEEIENKNAKDN